MRSTNRAAFELRKERVEFVKVPDELSVQDTQLTVGHLRALVEEADARGWSDKSVVLHGEGGVHSYRRDARIAKSIIVQGVSAQPAE